jgi:Peptidase C39 family/HlyD family secretion protein
MAKFPFYKQLDTMDCGPTCLRMIAHFYGKIYSQDFLREKASINRNGVSIAGIAEAAELIGLQSLSVAANFETLAQDIPLPNFRSLGDIQNNYSNFVSEYEAFKIFSNSDSKEKQLIAYNKQLNDFQILLQQYSKQRDNLESELTIINHDVERNTILLKEGVVSSKELEDKQREPLRIKRQLEDISIAQSNTQISISNTERNIIELKSQNNETGNQIKLRIFEAYQNLMNKISEWEQTFVIKAPTEGYISYFSFWSENQNVKQGDEVFTIIPTMQTEIIGKILLPIQSTGKLKVGQKAIIKLDNFPYAEFGIIEGKVKKVSIVPKQNQLAVEIDFNNQLITNTGTIITSKNDIQGNVSIITEDLRLIERIFYQIRKIFL